MLKFNTLLITIYLAFNAFCVKAQDTIQNVIPNRYNSIAQQQKPYVILISIDGFRSDLADKYQAKNLIRLRDNGIQADYLKSSYPSLTFPNHYSIVTGLYPSHHGIVDNNFYDKKRDVVYRKSDKVMAVDSSWYGGKPLWVLAEQQKMLAAVFYWPGSEISMEGIRPTYYYNYSETIPMERRINVVKNWLQLPEEKRPHFIALYFPQVDKAAHNYGVDSEQTKSAVELVDDAIGKIVENAKATGLPINFIIVSDHGMTNVDQQNTIPLPKEIDLNQFKLSAGTSLIHLYANQKEFIKPTYKSLKLAANDYDVYLSKNIPKAWHYNTKQDKYNRVGDILLVPKLPKVFSINGVKPEIGQHGFDPGNSDMHATFYASGPQFKSGLKIPAFENVNVYPLIAKILELSFTEKIDGKEKTLAPILK